jgi:hypothetical protein
MICLKHNSNFHQKQIFYPDYNQENNIELDINNLIQKIMSITDQSLKEAEKRFFILNKIK